MSHAAAPEIGPVGPLPVSHGTVPNRPPPRPAGGTAVSPLPPRRAVGESRLALLARFVLLERSFFAPSFVSFLIRSGRQSNMPASSNNTNNSSANSGTSSLNNSAGSISLNSNTTKGNVALASSSRPAATEESIGVARVLRDFQALRPGQLSARAGEMLNVTSRHSIWLLCCRGLECGLVPVKYCYFVARK